jgi:hypothetical protein
MPEKRLSIALSEVLYLEIYCNECTNLSILPIKAQTERLGDSQLCSSCQKPFGALQDDLTAMRQILQDQREKQSEFAIRLVIQE